MVNRSQSKYTYFTQLIQGYVYQIVDISNLIYLERKLIACFGLKMFYFSCYFMCYIFPTLFSLEFIQFYKYFITVSIVLVRFLPTIRFNLEF